MDTKEKPLWRLIIEKWFCHHQFRTIDRIDIKKLTSEVVEITLLRECTICGKSKINKL